MVAMLWHALEPAPRQLQLLRQGDWLGMFTMAVGLGCLETVLEEGNKNDWFGSPFIVRLAVIGVLSLSVFIYVELKCTGAAAESAAAGASQLRSWHLRELHFRFFDVRLDLPSSAVPGAHAVLHSQQIGGVMIWIGLPQLLLIPLLPKIMQRVDSRWLVIVGYILFIAGSLLAFRLSDDFSGPQFLSSSLVRALAQVMTMAPLSAIAIAGIEHEYAGSASALFQCAMRNMGGGRRNRRDPDFPDQA